MKLRNSTHYDDDDLRRIITEIHYQLSKVEGRLKTWCHLTVTVKKAQYGETRHWYSGCASLSGRSMTIRLSGIRNPINNRTFIQIVWHELLHSYGYHHKSIGKGGSQWRPSDDKVMEVCRKQDLHPYRMIGSGWWSDYLAEEHKMAAGHKPKEDA